MAFHSTLMGRFYTVVPHPPTGGSSLLSSLSVVYLMHQSSGELLR